MSEEVKAVAKWRIGHEHEFKICEQLQRIAEGMSIGDYVEVRRGWYPPTLDDTEHGDSLEQFSARVRRMSEALGRPPDDCSGDGSQWREGQAPDLVAVWKMGDDVGLPSRFVIQVRVMTPADCKVDPRDSFIEKQTQGLHPECKAVLAELEDGR